MELKIGLDSVLRNRNFSEKNGSGNQICTEKGFRIFLFKIFGGRKILLNAGICRTAFFLKLIVRGF